MTKEIINTIFNKETSFCEKELEKKEKSNFKSLSLGGDDRCKSLKVILKEDIAKKVRDCSCTSSDDNPWK